MEICGCNPSACGWNVHPCTWSPIWGAAVFFPLITQMSGQVSFCLLAPTAWTIDYLHVWGRGALWCLCGHAPHWLRSDCRPSVGWRGQTTYACFVKSCLSVRFPEILFVWRETQIYWVEKKAARITRLKLNTWIKTHHLWTLSYFRCFEKISESFRLFLIVRIPQRECTGTHALNTSCFKPMR